MVLTKEELINALQNEVRILLHLASKVEPAMLNYRPTATQRTVLELLQYIAIMGPSICVPSGPKRSMWMRGATPG